MTYTYILATAWQTSRLVCVQTINHVTTQSKMSHMYIQKWYDYSMSVYIDGNRYVNRIYSWCLCQAMNLHLRINEGLRTGVV